MTAQLIKVIHKRYLTSEDLVKVGMGEVDLFVSAELFSLCYDLIELALPQSMPISLNPEFHR